MKVVNIVIAFLVLSVVGLGATSLQQWKWLRDQNKENAKLRQQIEDKKFADKKAADAKKAEEEKVAQERENWAAELEQDTVGAGEGPWHVIRRQIVADPQYYGFEGDSKDEALVKNWAEDKTRQFALDFGYLDPRPEIQKGEVRIINPDEVAIVIVKNNDGGFICQEFVKGADGVFPESPANTYKAPGSGEQGQFLAHQGSDGDFVANSPAYEYFQPPVLGREGV